MRKIELINASCADQEVDVVVNAANSGLWAGGGICGVIFKKAGLSELTAACKKHKTPLNDGDAVCCAYPITKNTKYIISVTASGLFKKTSISEFTVQGKNTKGSKIHKLTEKDRMADFISLADEGEVLVASTRSCIKISVNDIPTLSRVTQGAKAIKMNDTDKIVGISLY